MSVESLAIALHHSRAQGTARLVLIGIANHDGDNGAWPSLSTLAKYAGGVAERTVTRALRELEQLGEIRTMKNAGGLASTRPDQRPNLYHFLLRCPNGCDRTSAHRDASHGVSHMSPRQVNGVTLAAERGDTGGTNGVTQVSPEPLLEPSMNGGESSSVTSPAREATTPTPKKLPEDTPTTVRPDRCGTHQLVEFAPPCMACKAARQRVEAEALERAEAERGDQARARRAEYAAKAAVIAHCRHCDSAGYTPTGGLCSHDPVADAASAQRAKEWRERIRRGDIPDAE